MSHFTGATAVVTGAASGIGRALCLQLCKEGAHVHAADINAGQLASLEEAGAGRLSTHILDVTDGRAFSSLLKQVAERRGRLDYLFNNAGIVVGGTFEHMTQQVWQKIIDINLWGVVHGTQAAYALMLRQGSGHIINTASTAGVTPVAKSVAYAATKHAVVGLSVSLREEARRHGVCVSVAIPGLVDTGIFSAATNLGSHDYATAMNQLPLKKISPEAAAQAMLAGTARNQQFIIFPGYNRLLVALYRMAPAAIGRLLNLTSTR